MNWIVEGQSMIKELSRAVSALKGINQEKEADDEGYSTNEICQGVWLRRVVLSFETKN